MKTIMVLRTAAGTLQMITNYNNLPAIPRIGEHFTCVGGTYKTCAVEYRYDTDVTTIIVKGE